MFDRVYNQKFKQRNKTEHGTDDTLFLLYIQKHFKQKLFFDDDVFILYDLK